MYVLVGITIWGLFANIFGGMSHAMMSSWALLRYASFPHEAVLFVQVLVKLTTFLFSFIIALLVLAVFGVAPSPALLLFPAVVAPLVVLGAALGLIMAPLAAVSWDFYRVIAWLVNLLMFATPVIYSPSAIQMPALRAIVHLNPLTYLVCSARDIVLQGRLLSTQGYALSAVGACIAFLAAWRVFYMVEDKTVERLF
jgi:lipopolysaccharide transport system permease protein